MSSQALEPIIRPRLADQVHEILLDAILTGELVAGQQLHDRAWSARLDISRMPVREAFQYLQWQGLTDVQAARYTKLLSFTAESARDEAAGWATVHASLADLLCTIGDDVPLDQLRRAQTRHSGADSEVARTRANFEFFRILREASGHFSVNLSGTAMSYRLRLAATNLPDSRDADAVLQTEIIQAISNGDAAVFREAFDHWTLHLTHGGHSTGTAA